MMNASQAIKVIIVDDSAVVRGVLRRLLEAEPQIEVAAAASNGELALKELRQHAADVVLLDIEMPVMDGMTALRRIVVDYPAVKVIMVSTLTRRNAEISLEALRIGAADYVAKPEAGIATAAEFGRDLIARVKALATRRPSRVSLASSPTSVPRYAPTRRPVVRALGIGASTGGPPALLNLFRALQGGVGWQPVFVTQHMPATFTTLLAEQIGRAAGRPCVEGKDGEPVRPGHIYVAPGGWHMRLENGPTSPVIRLDQGAPEHFCRPAVDPMLRSLAAVYGDGALAAILTGMGADGALGCEAVVRAGGRFITQDQATSAVWGMPAAAAATGLAEAVLPLDDIGPWLRRVTETAA
ncbi:MAG: chemotaxis response regulator protein-glutamate methylesterase [Candidatus Brevundimonas phytovorans]|nr:chemotaxis response regulator protein-glutamate methylesterase [Brevundimonas sp.]WEK59236.1 MAG: chemotaxis response regulator protein-glutamate methylesterase [Brevundimonas sp.]